MERLLNDLRDMVLCDIEDTVKKGQISPSDYQALGEAVDIVKDIETIEAMRNYGYEEPETSLSMGNVRSYPYDPNRYGNSYGSNYNRMRSNHMMRSVSKDDETMAKLNRMMGSAQTDVERATIQRMMDELGK